MTTHLHFTYKNSDFPKQTFSYNLMKMPRMVIALLYIPTRVVNLSLEGFLH